MDARPSARFRLQPLQSMPRFLVVLFPLFAVLALLLRGRPVLTACTDAPPRERWAWLPRHALQADLDHCPRCGGPMRWLEAATTREAAARLLGKLGLAPQPPPRPGRAPWGQLELPFRT